MIAVAAVAGLLIGGYLTALIWIKVRNLNRASRSALASLEPGPSPAVRYLNRAGAHVRVTPGQQAGLGAADWMCLGCGNHGRFTSGTDGVLDAVLDAKIRANDHATLCRALPNPPSPDCAQPSCTSPSRAG
jgi:hypothetical protein